MGIMGNLGALMMGGQGSLDRALDYTNQAIDAGVEASVRESEAVAGKSPLKTCSSRATHLPLCPLQLDKAATISISSQVLFLLSQEQHAQHNNAYLLPLQQSTRLWRTPKHQRRRYIATLAAAHVLRSNWIHAGAYFNRGKILGMMGREEEAQAAYEEAVEAAQGVSPGSYFKALASLKQFDAGQVEVMEDAARFLRSLSGAQLGSAAAFFPAISSSLLSTTSQSVQDSAGNHLEPQM